MSHAQLLRGVARSTGESPRTLRRLGFGLAPGPRIEPALDDSRLAVDCPRCGQSRPLVCDRHGIAAMGECPPCDLLFGYRPEEVYLASDPAAA